MHIPLDGGLVDYMSMSVTNMSMSVGMHCCLFMHISSASTDLDVGCADTRCGTVILGTHT